MNQQSYSINDPLEKKEFEIIVNGRAKKWRRESITFREVVELAFGFFEKNLVTVYTVTFMDSVPNGYNGTMIMGDTVSVKERTIFNVTSTSKS